LFKTCIKGAFSLAISLPQNESLYLMFTTHASYFACLEFESRLGEWLSRRKFSLSSSVPPSKNRDVSPYLATAVAFQILPNEVSRYLTVRLFAFSY
jgi:hypothetical protein